MVKNLQAVGKLNRVYIAMILAAGGIIPLGVSMSAVQAFADSGGPSGCPDPGQCTCNAASGVMTDHAMPPPFNRINNGCTESGWF